MKTAILAQVKLCSCSILPSGLCTGCHLGPGMAAASIECSSLLRLKSELEGHVSKQVRRLCFGNPDSA